jgi:hypothetical protein
LNEKSLFLCSVIIFLVAVALLATTIADRVGRRSDRGAELRTAAEAEYRRLESDYRRATVAIDGIEDGLGRIERIASEIDRDNDGAIGAIRRAIEVVEQVRIEVANLERSIDNFRNHDDSGGATLEN